MICGVLVDLPAPAAGQLCGSERMKEVFMTTHPESSTDTPWLVPIGTELWGLKRFEGVDVFKHKGQLVIEPPQRMRPALQRLLNERRQEFLDCVRLLPHPGPRSRRDRVEPRWLAVECILANGNLPRRRKWSEVLRRLYGLDITLTLTSPLPLGETVDSVAPHWVNTHTISLRDLKDGFRRWRKRQAAARADIANIRPKKVKFRIVG
jgi:hypothetical protein